MRALAVASKLSCVAVIESSRLTVFMHAQCLGVNRLTDAAVPPRCSPRMGAERVSVVTMHAWLEEIIMLTKPKRRLMLRAAVMPGGSVVRAERPASWGWLMRVFI